MNKTWNLKRIILIGLFMAINMLLTFINIPVGQSMMHLGSLALFITVLFLNPIDAALASGLGMGLFDLLGGHAQWVLPTLIIKGLMAFVVAVIVRKGKPECENIAFNLLGYVIGAIISLIGYYLAKVIFTGSFIVPLASIPGSILTSTVGIIISLPVGLILVKRLKFLKSENR